jgi:hypothetical protein
VTRLALLLIALTACGRRPDSPAPDGHAVVTDDAHADATGNADAPSDGRSPVHDASPDTPPSPDAFPSVLDVRIDCHNTCVLTAHPAAINVSAGTSFQVNWINIGDTDCDVTKVDQFNHVPIVLGLEPGTSYFDSVRTWCGPQFTGTFDFEISICTIPSEIPVNCGA